jgi:hypothetical protein
MAFIINVRMHPDFQISVVLRDFILIRGSVTTLDHDVLIYNLFLRFFQVLLINNVKSI